MDRLRLKRRAAGHYTTADGRWKIFREGTNWKINAMTRPDAAWLRQSGLLSERFATRQAAVQTLLAWAGTASDLPAAESQLADRLRPLRHEAGKWVSADGSVVLQRPSINSAWYGKKLWVVRGRQWGTARLLEQVGVGTRVFTRRDQALAAAAAALDDAQIVGEVNQQIADANATRAAVAATCGWPVQQEPLLKRLSQR